MEITSAPEPKTVEVIDLDIRFPGETQELRLFPGDTEGLEENGRVTFHLAPQQLGPGISTPGEDVVVFVKHVLWVRRTKTTITLPPDEADAPAHRTK